MNGVLNLKSSLEKGGKRNPFWIAGPCVLEDQRTNFQIAREVERISQKLGIPTVFKASFDKANRTSHESARGPGLVEGLKALLEIKKEFRLPLLTDVHETSQVGATAEVCDILQIPAFLCRQTDLLEAAARSGRALNVKKGQFVSPENVASIVNKLSNFGARDFWITERGVCFGYQRLVVDFASFPLIERQNVSLVLDVTHSVQIMGGGGDRSGGIREAIPYLARAGAAVGVSGFFAETHPNPSQALSDGPNAWPLDQLEGLLSLCQRIANSAHA